MTHIANKGDAKFDHLVGGYPRYEPSAGRPVQFIEEAFQIHRCGGPLAFPSVDEFEAHASGVLARMTTHIAERAAARPDTAHSPDLTARLNARIGAGDLH